MAQVTAVNESNRYRGCKLYTRSSGGSYQFNSVGVGTFVSNGDVYEMVAWLGGGNRSMCAAVETKVYKWLKRNRMLTTRISPNFGEMVEPISGIETEWLEDEVFVIAMEVDRIPNVESKLKKLIDYVIGQ